MMLECNAFIPRSLLPNLVTKPLRIPLLAGALQSRNPVENLQAPELPIHSLIARAGTEHSIT